MLLDDLIFRLQHFKSDKWNVPEHFVFFKIKDLVDQYEYFLTKNSSFKPNNIFELGIFDGGSTAFWYEAFQPKKLVAIDLLDREDSPYFHKYIISRGLSKKNLLNGGSTRPISPNCAKLLHPSLMDRSISS